MTQRFSRRQVTLGGVLILAAIALVGLWGHSGFSTPSPATSRDETSDEPAIVHALVCAPVAVAPGVYLLGGMSPAAAYVVDTSAGLVLVDSGLESSAAAVKEQLATLRLDIRRLRAILLTHVHADHCQGAEELRRLTGARVYAGRGDCPPLRDGAPREAFVSTYDTPAVVIHPTTVDVELSGGETLEFGETQFEAIATPGHTPGSTSYLLKRSELRALFTGDVVWSLGTSKSTPLGTYIAYLPPRYRGNAADYLTSLRRLRALPLPDLILPGHPANDPVAAQSPSQRGALARGTRRGHYGNGDAAGPLCGRRRQLPRR